MDTTSHIQHSVFIRIVSGACANQFPDQAGLAAHTATGNDDCTSIKSHRPCVYEDSATRHLGNKRLQPGGEGLQDNLQTSRSYGEVGVFKQLMLALANPQ
jgi:hypothetical protein